MEFLAGGSGVTNFPPFNLSTFGLWACAHFGANSRVGSHRK